MDFNTILKRLHARPKHERQVIAVGTAGSITAVVALIWMVNLFSGLATPSSSQTAGAADAISQSQGVQHFQQGLQEAQAQHQKFRRQLEEQRARLEASAGSADTNSIEKPDYNAYINQIREQQEFEQEVEKIKQQRAQERNNQQLIDPTQYGSGSVYNVVE